MVDYNDGMLLCEIKKRLDKAKKNAADLMNVSNVFNSATEIMKWFILVMMSFLGFIGFILIAIYLFRDAAIPWLKVTLDIWRYSIYFMILCLIISALFYYLAKSIVRKESRRYENVKSFIEMKDSMKEDIIKEVKQCQKKIRKKCRTK